MSTWPTSPKGPNAAPLVPPEIRELLGPSPVLSGEDPAHYDKAFAQIALAIDPQDFVEWIWVKDLADILWDAARIRRAKTVRLALARGTALSGLFEAVRMRAPSESPVDLMGYVVRQARGVMDNQPPQLMELDRILKILGLDRSAIEDAAFHASLDDMERLQALLDKAAARRDTILREIDRRRSSARARLKDTIDALEPTLDSSFADGPG